MFNKDGVDSGIDVSLEKYEIEERAGASDNGAEEYEGRMAVSLIVPLSDL